MLYSKDADADRAFFRDVLDLPHVDVGHGWLIFRLPPTEFGVHPIDSETKHELYLMCDDVEATIADLRAKGVACTDVQEEPWGRLTAITLPGGSDLGIYQPHHPSP